MPLVATPARRRLAMIALLALAAAGGVIRKFADNPSTLRDIGTLLLVLWLPAVGNLIAWVIRQIPRSAPPATDFAEGALFTPQLRVQIEATGVTPEMLATLDATTRMCTVLAGRRGFTARTERPLAQVLSVPGPQTLPLELLHPKVGLPQLAAGSDFHLLIGTTAVAKGRILPA